MFLQIRSFAIVTSAVFLNPLLIAISPLSSSAETFQVYKDDKLTGGRAIIGTGQNLPALSSSGVWAIGNFPKEEIEKYHNKQVLLINKVWQMLLLHGLTNGLNLDVMYPSL